MEIFINKRAKCQLDGCDNPVSIPLGSRSRRKYCSDSHRKYAWKKRNWESYLAWQRQYEAKKAHTKKALV